MKHFAVGFCCMLTAVLVFCVMELQDEVSIIDGILLGFAATISVVGCIVAAVAIAETK